MGTGIPQPSILWSFNGNQLENGILVTITEEVYEENGVTFVRSFLELSSVAITDEGLYQCTVANRLVNDSTVFALAVNLVGGEPAMLHIHVARELFAKCSILLAAVWLIRACSWRRTGHARRVMVVTIICCTSVETCL